MRKINLIVLAGLVLAAIGFYACSNSNSPMTGSNTDPQTEAFITQNNLDSPLPAGTITANDVTDMTIDQPMAITPTFCQNGVPGIEANRIILGKILRNHAWTAGQRDTLKTYLQDYKSCYNGYIGTLKPLVIAVIDTANKDRKAIIDSVKAGTLTVANARTELQALSAARRAQIQTLITNSGICDCINTFLNNIGALINLDYPKQYPNWEAWMATLKGPCFK